MKKFLAVILAAAVFGGVAGATIYGINYLGGGGLRTEETEAAPGTDAPDDAAPDGEQDQAPVISKSSEQAPQEEPAGGGRPEQPAQSSQSSASASSSASSGYVLDVSDIVEEAMPEVVSITNTMVIQQQGYSSLFDYFYGQGQTQEYEVPASGSGIILSKTEDEILVITNNHVIEDSKELTVTFVDGTSVNANVKGYDSSLDIAVIAIPISDIPAETMSAIRVATYHDSDDLKVGQGVIAIGNALGYGQTVTVGIISALGREISAEGSTYSDLIQVDAAINPGNSGGALLNMQGEVIGINVAKLASSSVEATGYAIPIYKVMDVIENLSTAKTKVEVEEEKRGRLGIYMNTITADNAEALGIPSGVIIRGFSDEYMEYYGLDSVQESPARKAGLLKNDIITKVDGQSISSAEELANLISYYESGDTVTVTYQRLDNGSYAEYTADVTLGSYSDTVIDPVNEEEVPESAGAGNSGDAKGSGRGSGQNGSRGSEPPAESGSEQQPSEGSGGDRDADAGTGSSGSSWTDEMYDLFREFIEQYE